MNTKTDKQTIDETLEEECPYAMTCAFMNLFTEERLGCLLERLKCDVKETTGEEE